jgi:uncharacterized membrane protein YoaK (UPF0700 family)
MAMVEELREVFFPPKGSPHGPVAPLLLLLTFVTGLVDAFSYLALGHVFVANMTGNVLFLAFGLAGAHGLSVGASLVALVAFVVGAVAGGRIHTMMKGHRARLLELSSFVQAGLLAVSFVLALGRHNVLDGGLRYAVVVVLAVAMGVQNAASRKLAVPDFTTTVLTLTLTGIGADSPLAGGGGSKTTRRMLRAGCWVALIRVGSSVGANTDRVSPPSVQASTFCTNEDGHGRHHPVESDREAIGRGTRTRRVAPR